MPEREAGRLQLPDVTLCAISSVNIAATVRALRHSMAQARFGEVLLFTDATGIALPPGIRTVPITRLGSAADYSRFVLDRLHPWIATSHCLIVQWDGFIIDPGAWDDAFLSFDYLGAPWPQFADGHDVGNGGFSLRTRRLLAACAAPEFQSDGLAEDLAICRTHRDMLERRHGMRYADRATAARFSFERDRTAAASFGFHGAFNLIQAAGFDAFWEIYRSLDDRGTVWTDFWAILREVVRGPHGPARAARIIIDRLLRK